MSSLEHLFFDEMAERHGELIAKLKADLTEYAMSGNAKSGYVDKQNKLIADLATFHQHATEAIEALKQENQDAYTRGLQNGYRKGLSDKERELMNERTTTPSFLSAHFEKTEDGYRIRKPGKETSLHDPESVRIYSIQRAMQTQPNLFTTDYQTNLFT